MTASKANDAPGIIMGPDTILIQRRLPGPIERVWAYLVDPEKRSLWLAAGTMDLRVGGAVALSFNHADLSAEKQTPERFRRVEEGPSRLHGTITLCEPPRVLGFTWGDHGEVMFQLVAQADEVLLMVTHRRLHDRAARVNVAGGWHAHLAILVDRMEGREPRGFWSAYATAEAQYEKLL